MIGQHNIDVHMLYIKNVQPSLYCSWRHGPQVHLCKEQKGRAITACSPGAIPSHAPTTRMYILAHACKVQTVRGVPSNSVPLKGSVCLLLQDWHAAAHPSNIGTFGPKSRPRDSPHIVAHSILDLISHSRLGCHSVSNDCSGDSGEFSEVHIRTCTHTALYVIPSPNLWFWGGVTIRVSPTLGRLSPHIFPKGRGSDLLPQNRNGEGFAVT